MGAMGNSWDCPQRARQPASVRERHTAHEMCKADRTTLAFFITLLWNEPSLFHSSFSPSRFAAGPFVRYGSHNYTVDDLVAGSAWVLCGQPCMMLVTLNCVCMKMT